MVKRDISRLAVVSIDEDLELLPLKSLREIYIKKTSEIIYIVKNKKLYGIVCMGEILYGHKKNLMVKINKKYTALIGYNLIKAHEIFQKRGGINKIPVINENGELLGDYSRWEDNLFLDRNFKVPVEKRDFEEALEPYDVVYLIEPIEEKHHYFFKFLEHLEDLQIEFMVLDKELISSKLGENAIIIFADEDERRGMQCLHGLEPAPYDYRGYNTFRFDNLRDPKIKVRLSTYKNLLIQIIEEVQLKRLKVSKLPDLPCQAVDDKADIFLSALKSRGVKCFCTYENGDEVTDFWKSFDAEVWERLQNHPISFRKPWSKGKEKDKEFYGELYRLEDYQKEIAQKEIFLGSQKFEYSEDINGKYFNSKDKRRITCFQPEEYVGTIYLLGLCLIVGRFAEDQFTIASYLQKKLLEKGYQYRVENYGSFLRLDGELEQRLEEIGSFDKNDIVIFQSRTGGGPSSGRISLKNILERGSISTKWVTDMYSHCNYIVNEIIADGIMETIEPDLSCAEPKNVDLAKVRIDFCKVMEDYVRQKYLHVFFKNFSGEKYDTVGAVVMKCNPFHKGHRYLIEQARRQVDFLIVFVIDEDRYIFSFEERYKLIKDGVKDMDNVMVVPNGDFIFSRNNFREYYDVGGTDEVIAYNAEYDIRVFADYIAKPLHITHRFTGWESKKRVLRIYNETMKKILQQKGINCVVIPKTAIGDEIISASKIRKYLKEENYEKAFSMLPETTSQYLLQQI